MDDIVGKLDGLLGKHNEAISEISACIEQIKNEVCMEKMKYATNFDFLGLFCPSLVMDKITSGYKKGRIQSKQPKSTQYSKCYFNVNGKLLYFENYNQFGCDSTYYFKEIDGVIWAAPFTGTGTNAYPALVHCFFYDKGKIKEYASMTSGSIWLEEYEHNQEENSAICHRYYYVPHKKENKLTRMKIEIFFDDSVIKRLVCFDVMNDREEMSYIWEK